MPDWRGFRILPTGDLKVLQVLRSVCLTRSGRKRNLPIGLKVETNETDNVLTVQYLHADGLVPRWNDEPKVSGGLNSQDPNRRVKEGDRIVSVNGIRGQAEEIMALLKANMFPTEDGRGSQRSLVLGFERVLLTEKRIASSMPGGGEGGCKQPLVSSSFSSQLGSSLPPMNWRVRQAYRLTQQLRVEEDNKQRGPRGLI